MALQLCLNFGTDILSRWFTSSDSKNQLTIHAFSTRQISLLFPMLMTTESQLSPNLWWMVSAVISETEASNFNEKRAFLSSSEFLLILFLKVEKIKYIRPKRDLSRRFWQQQKWKMWTQIRLPLHRLHLDLTLKGENLTMRSHGSTSVSLEYFFTCRWTQGLTSLLSAKWLASQAIRRWTTSLRSKPMSERQRNDSQPNWNLNLECYVDVYFGGLHKSKPDTNHQSPKSRTGFMITIGSVPVFWKSKIQTEISLSNLVRVFGSQPKHEIFDCSLWPCNWNGQQFSIPHKIKSPQSCALSLKITMVHWYWQHTKGSPTGWITLTLFILKSGVVERNLFVQSPHCCFVTIV
jgi:hypothetical protein